MRTNCHKTTQNPAAVCSAGHACGGPLVLRAAAHLHGDEGGTMSIVSVFTLMFLAMLLGMVTNVGKQVDGKVKMQNAADAATWSGGLVLARGMNTLAFTNHLLCDIFSVTALLREAEQQNAYNMVPPILQAWQKIGPVLANSPFPKFAQLGPAITQKVPMEQQMVQAYSDWIKGTADIVLPVWEQILQQELIPKFQRALVTATPQLAQLAANEIAREHGLGSPERGNMQAAMWRTTGDALGGDGEANRRTLPVVDPELDNLPNQAQYMTAARRQRNNLANHYLKLWNNQMMAAFDQIAKMSQFGVLWRGFTCGQLDKLLNQDYPTSNLPFVIRSDGNVQVFGPIDLEQDYHFIGVCYWPPVVATLPGLFGSPTNTSVETYAEVSLYIPRNKLIRVNNAGAPGNPGNPGIPIGGVPGDPVTLPGTGNAGNGGGNNAGNNNPAGQQNFIVGRQGNPQGWTLLNQTWTIKIVPAVSTNLMTILQTPPPANGNQGSAPQVPSISNLSVQDWNSINTH